jgi:endonuclease YncB( thermonuclease family)|tara:strand:+ start:254 stop:628 length:375 start_codon:yes stop_codon:yes gene_type:complete
MYEYKIKSVDHLVDGDTFDCTVDLGFNISHKIRVRMYGINTPESRTRDLEEKARGLASKERLHTLLSSGFLDDNGLVLVTNKKGKYGRYLGTVYRQRKSGEEQLNINQQLIEEGFAVEYYGGKR